MTRIFICFSFLLLLACNMKNNNASTSVNNDVLGVDLSHHNGIVEIPILQKNNIQFAYIKSTEGVSVEDKEYKKNIENLRNNGIKVGSYHFFIFSEDGENQANHFINHSQFQSGDLIPVLDVEYSRNNPYSTDSTYLKKISSEIRKFNKFVEQNIGQLPIIYCSEEMYYKIQDSNEKQKYWIVDLKNKPDSTINWAIWQFEHNKKLNNLNINLSKLRHDRKGLNDLTIHY